MLSIAVDCDLNAAALLALHNVNSNKNSLKP